MSEVFENHNGVRFSNQHSITDLMFADDSSIFANDDADAKEILNNVARTAKPYGLQINTEKTKVLTTDGSLATVYLNRVQIEQVKQFKYLGSLVQEKSISASLEVHSRIGQATSAFASLRWCVWHKSNVALATKIRLYRTLVLPILLYGSETWTLLKKDLNKLETFQMRCLRTILRISLRDHRKNVSVHEQCDKQSTIEELIQQRRHRWFGHVCRMKADRLPNALLWQQRPVNWRIRRGAPRKPG